MDLQISHQIIKTFETAYDTHRDTVVSYIMSHGIETAMDLRRRLSKTTNDQETSLGRRESRIIHEDYAITLTEHKTGCEQTLITTTSTPLSPKANSVSTKEPPESSTTQDKTALQFEPTVTMVSDEHCRNFNYSPQGCGFKTCKYKHRCLLCNGNHGPSILPDGKLSNRQGQQVQKVTIKSLQSKTQDPSMEILPFKGWETKDTWATLIL